MIARQTGAAPSASAGAAAGVDLDPLAGALRRRDDEKRKALEAEPWDQMVAGGAASMSSHHPGAAQRQRLVETVFVSGTRLMLDLVSCAGDRTRINALILEQIEAVGDPGQALMVVSFALRKLAGNLSGPPAVLAEAAQLAANAWATRVTDIGEGSRWSVT